MSETFDRNTWQTPDYILDAVRDTFGGQIDLDPASDGSAQARVRARVWYGQGSPHGEDGLTEDWRLADESFVFVNPPYGKGLLTPFVEKLRAEHERFPGLSSALLVNLDPSTRWFQRAVEHATHVVLLHKRVAFIHPATGKPVAGNSRPQTIILRRPRFIRQWRSLGTVCGGM